MMNKKRSAEKTVRDIRRATRRKYSAEEKIRIVIEGLRGEDSIAGCAVEKALTPMSITVGPRSLWKRARNVWQGMLSVKQPAYLSNRLQEKLNAGAGR